MPNAINGISTQPFVYSAQAPQQQVVYRPKEESKLEAYGKTAAKGFIFGAAIDGAFQLLGPHVRKLFANKQEKAAIDSLRKVGAFKLNPRQMAGTGLIFAIIDIGLKVFSGR